MVVLLTGACGYCGSVLVPKLLAAGYEVIALDIMWFGENLPKHRNLKIVKADIREMPYLWTADAVIHLAAVANDPTGDLDPKLTWEVNALATMQLADSAERKGVRQFIYASSGSVYGVSRQPQVTENVPLAPLSEYNKTKMVAERCLLSYDMNVQIIRPATVCGVSPRMRLDVVVNMLTMQALTKGVITVLGGEQVRPNIHIDDLTDLYLFMLDHPELTGIYNAGFENLTVLEIAELVKQFVPCEIEVQPSKDPRSYRMNSDKLLARGFKPKFDVETAIMDVCAAYQAGKLKDDDRHYNLRAMKAA